MMIIVRKHFWFIAVLVCLVVILYAGLRPFNFRPANAVAWLADRDGIDYFNDHALSQCRQKQGMICSSGPLTFQPLSVDSTEFSLELLSASRPQSCGCFFTLLSLFDDSAQPSLLIARWCNHLVVRIRNSQCNDPRQYREIGSQGALPADAKILITLVSGSRGTELYLNGRLAESYPGLFVIPPGEPYIQNLILGADPNGRNAWSGCVYGLAFYRKALDAATVNTHYHLWTAGKTDELSRQEDVISLYSFSQRTGSVVRDMLAGGVNLVIPSHFIVLHKTFLEPFWGVSGIVKLNIPDIIINTLGFIPLGFFLAGWLHDRFPFSIVFNTCFTFLFGSAVSLSIELLQGLIPIRYSSFLDVVCNSFGTLVGLVVLMMMRRLFQKKCILNPHHKISGGSEQM